jgi:E1-E2 ATPase
MEISANRPDWRARIPSRSSKAGGEIIGASTRYPPEDFGELSFRGDLIVLAEGDRVPADAVLVESHDLQVDESLLSGKSVPVRKVARPDAVPSEGHRPGGDNLPWVFSGSLVVRGTGTGEVTATGARKPSLTDLTIVWRCR